MDFNHTERTSHPRALVFETHRDELDAVVAHLPDVRRVELQSSSTHADGRLEQLYRWHGSHGALPMLVRPFVKESLLVWEQRTVWDPARWRADWEIAVPGMGAALECRGSNAYLEQAGGGTTIEVEGSFDFTPHRVSAFQGVPDTAIPMVERMVVSLVVPMIQRSGRAVADYLGRRGAR